MGIALLGLGGALLWVTVTAVIGFLSNLVSPVRPIQEFGLVAGFGIAATLVIFLTLVPASKVILDELLEARGWDRRRRAFGTKGGRFTRVLSGGRVLAQRAPLVVIAVVLVVTLLGVAGATQVDTTFQQDDFIADEPPTWMQSLPGGLGVGEYTVKTNFAFVNERFFSPDSQTQILVRGDVTSDDALTDVATAETLAAEQPVVVRVADGTAEIRSPLATMREVAATDEEFATAFEAADTTDDGVPDQNVEAVYDALFAAAPQQAADVIHRTDDGEYAAFRLVISIDGGASVGEATSVTRTVAGSLEGAERTATATGQLVVFDVIEGELFTTVLQSLVVTMVAVFLFLMSAYRVVHGRPPLVAVTLAPILLTVAWILGTMALLDIPFNVLTGTITSLTIGLGVAYNIHMSERYRLELTACGEPWTALERAVTGTGGALLGSAATTAGGFGLLGLAILPPLQQFGLITGVTIVYAFLAGVFVLPTLLVFWTRFAGPTLESRTEQAAPDPTD